MHINTLTQVYDETKVSSKQSHKLKCPYINKHHVQPRSFASHLEKCRQKLSVKQLQKFATCKYNSFHIFTVYQIGAHEMTCPNRESMITIQKQLLDKQKIYQEQVSHVSSQSQQKQGETSIRPQSHQQKQQMAYFQNCQQQNLSNSQAIGSEYDKNQQKRQKQNQKQKYFDLIFNMSCTEMFGQKLLIDNQQSQEGVQTSEKCKPIIVEQQQKIKSGINFTNKQQKQILKINDSQKKNMQQYSKDMNNNRRINPQNLESKVKKSIQNEQIKQLQLHQCWICCQILCNDEKKISKNKKLVKLLKAYRKLQNQQAQFQDCINKNSKINFFPNSLFKKQNQSHISIKVSKPSNLFNFVQTQTSFHESKKRYSWKQPEDIDKQQPKEGVVEKNDSTSQKDIQIISQICKTKKQSNSNNQEQKPTIETSLSNDLTSNWVIIKD